MAKSKSQPATDPAPEVDPLAADPSPSPGTQPAASAEAEVVQTSAPAAPAAEAPAPTEAAAPAAAAPAAATSPDPGIFSALGTFGQQLRNEAIVVGHSLVKDLKLSPDEETALHTAIHGLVAAGAARLGQSEPDALHSAVDARNAALGTLKSIGSTRVHELEELAVTAAHTVFANAQDLVRGHLAHEGVGLLTKLLSSKLGGLVLTAVKLVA